MAQSVRRLGDGELDIMLVIWGTREAVNSSYIQEKLKAHRQWTLPAVANILYCVCIPFFSSIISF